MERMEEHWAIYCSVHTSIDSVLDYFIRLIFYGPSSYSHLLLVLGCSSGGVGRFSSLVVVSPHIHSSVQLRLPFPIQRTVRC